MTNKEQINIVGFRGTANEIFEKFNEEVFRINNIKRLSTSVMNDIRIQDERGFIYCFWAGSSGGNFMHVDHTGGCSGSLQHDKSTYTVISMKEPVKQFLNKDDLNGLKSGDVITIVDSTSQYSFERYQVQYVHYLNGNRKIYLKHRKTAKMKTLTINDTIDNKGNQTKYSSGSKSTFKFIKHYGASII